MMSPVGEGHFSEKGICMPAVGLPADGSAGIAGHEVKKTWKNV